MMPDLTPSLAPRLQAYCPRCKNLVRVPDTLTLEDFHRVVALRRSGQTLQAVRALADTGATDLVDAKCLVFHIISRAGQCHRCRKPLPSGAEHCPNCRCATLDVAEET